MQHLSAELPGLLEPPTVRRLLADHRAALERLESQSLMAVTAERARFIHGECLTLQDRLGRLARAGYAPLSSMPWGSYVPAEFDRLGEHVNELLRRARRVIEHCNQIEGVIKLRQQADMDRDHRRRFPRELAILEEQRDILGVLYPDRWLLLHDGAIRAEFDTVHEALRSGDAQFGRDAEGRPCFLIYCHRTAPRT